MHSPNLCSSRSSGTWLGIMHSNNNNKLELNGCSPLLRVRFVWIDWPQHSWAKRWKNIDPAKGQHIFYCISFFRQRHLCCARWLYAICYGSTIFMRIVIMYWKCEQIINVHAELVGWVGGYFPPLRRFFQSTFPRSLCCRRPHNWRINHFTCFAESAAAVISVLPQHRPLAVLPQILSDTRIVGYIFVSAAGVHRCFHTDAFNKPNQTEPPLNCRQTIPLFSLFSVVVFLPRLIRKKEKSNKKIQKKRKKAKTRNRFVSCFVFSLVWLFSVAFIDFSIWNHSISLLILIFWLPFVRRLVAQL